MLKRVFMTRAFLSEKHILRNKGSRRTSHIVQQETCRKI